MCDRGRSETNAWLIRMFYINVAQRYDKGGSAISAQRLRNRLVGKAARDMRILE